VADILAQFPAQGFDQRDKLADQMLGLGETGIAEFPKRLVPAGTGNDTAVRFALNAMAVRASRIGAEPQRALAERALLNGLKAASDTEVRTFLLSQLRLVGRDASVKAAAPFLADADMVEPAAQLMLSVKGLAARTALAAALGKASGPGRVTIVKALGTLGAVEANDRLLALAKEPDAVLQKDVLAALARIGSPASNATLVAAAERAEFRYEPTNATAALLDYAKRLGEKGTPAASVKICRLIMQKTDDAERLPTRAAALAVLADVRGAAALPDLVAAVDHGDSEYRQAALLRAEKLRSPLAVQRWIAKARKVDAARRAEIVAMLGRQGTPAALPFVRASLSAREPEVRLASAEALARLQGAKAVPALLPLLESADAESAAKVAGILGWTIDEKHLDPLAAKLDSLQPPAKAAAIAVLAGKSGRRFADRVIPLTSDANADVKAAAYQGLAGVARPQDLPALLKLLDGADEANVPAVQKAVVAAALQAVPEEGRAKPIIEAMDGAAHPDRIIGVLPDVGGAQALAALVRQFEGAAPARKPAVFRALVQWKGHEAAGHLFAVASNGDPSLRDQAFAGFLRQVSSSPSLPADQKVLYLRKALPLAKDAAERKAVIHALERAKTFQSLLVAASFLDDKELASDAAEAVMRIALPTSGGRDGLSGTIVRDALNKVLQVLTGAESDYDKENIRTYLRTMTQAEGFVPLFNGKDLAGWKGLVENPIARAKMTPEQMAAKQVDADAKARTNWSVQDGMIVFNGAGDNLCTMKDYGDFEMVVDWRITKDGDSGIYLRGSPQVQIWDPARTDVGAQVGSGGLYNNQKNPSKPLVFADNPVGEWNTFRITMIGEKVSVFLNGVKVVDNVTMENYWDRAQPIFPRGAIELQAHGTNLAFRDIYVREISAPAPTLTEQERKEGFVPLFNGKNLDGWIGNRDGYKVEDGVISYDPKLGDKTNLYTAKEYGNFQLRFDFKLTPGANSGVGIRAPREGDAAYVGMEIQVLDDTAPVYATLQPYQYHGSVYGVIPAKRGALKPVGEWNSEEIFIQGSHIRVTLNGVVTVDGDLAEASRNGTIDHQQHPGLQRTAGYIGWLSHDSPVSFRNIRIKELPAAGK
jgi:HEAT repeat protein